MSRNSALFVEYKFLEFNHIRMKLNDKNKDVAIT